MKHNLGMYRGDGEGGLVLAPPPQNRFFCVYPGDGNSMGHYDENHGCQGPCTGKQTWDCAFEPERLEEGLTVNSYSEKYNEVVVDAQFMKRNLPHSLLGVFYMAPHTRERAASVHADFLRAYSISAAEFPLLHFSTTEGFKV